MILEFPEPVLVDLNDPVVRAVIATRDVDFAELVGSVLDPEPESEHPAVTRLDRHRARPRP